MPSPTLRRVVVALALGAATTVVVAWSGAVFEKAYNAPSQMQTLLFDTFTCGTYLQHGFFITRQGVTWRNGVRDAPLNPSWIDPRLHPELVSAPAWSRAWSTTRPVRPPATWSGPGESCLNEFAAGWPCRALLSRCDDPTQDPVSRHAVFPPSVGGFTLPCHIIRDGANIYLPRALPYTPIPLGLSVDTALFAALWAPLVWLPPARRAWRRRRGLCPACAYDLRGIPPGTACPECGPAQTAPVGD